MKAKFEAILVIKDIRKLMNEHYKNGQLAQAKYIMDYIRDNFIDPDWVELNKLEKLVEKDMKEILEPKEEFCECKTPKPLNLYWVKGEPKVCKCMKEIKPQPIEPETVFCDCGYPFKQCWCCKKPIEPQQEKIETLHGPLGIAEKKINEIIRKLNEQI